MASLNLSSTPGLTDHDPPLYPSLDLDTISGLQCIDKTGAINILARLTDSSRFFQVILASDWLTQNNANI